MARRRSRKKGPKGPPLAAVVKPPTRSRPKAEQKPQNQTAAPKESRRPIIVGIVPWGVLLGGIALFYLILKSYSLQPFAGDEFIYIYQSQLVAEGETPYRDFAMAHPPVQTLVTAAYLKLFGTDLITLRLLPVLWCLAGGVLLAFMVRRESGGIAGLFAALLYLTAHEPLRASSHFTGVNMTVTLLIAAVFLYRLKRLRTAALFAVLAVFTRLYAVPGVAALTAFALLVDRKEGLALIRYGAIFGVSALVLFGFWTGFGDMAHNLILYHAQKPPMNPESLLNMKKKVLFHNATLASLFVLSSATLFYIINRAYAGAESNLSFSKRARHAVLRTGTGLALLSTLIAWIMLLLLTNMDRVWMYYFIPSFPFAAAAAGWMIEQLARGGVAWIRAKGQLASAGIRRNDAYMGAAVVVLFVVSFVTAPMLEATLIYYKKAMDKPEKDRVHTYTFKSSPLPSSVDAWVRSTLWRDERTIGEVYNVFNYYLWHESRVLDIVDEVVNIIESETSEGDEIFGDSGTVPLFALISGRRIAGNEVDTNIQRYRSGNADSKETISKIDNDKTKMIILRHRFGVFGVAEVRRLVNEKYRRLKSVRSAQGKVFHIFKRNVAKESSS